MSVLLINPPRHPPQPADFPPIGLAYLAAMLRENGIQVNVLDAAPLSWHELRDSVKRAAPEIVGMPCWTVERGQTFKTAKLVKELLPAAKIIVGGHHATAFPEHMFGLAHADAVVVGEGEETVLELVEAFSDRRDLSTIKGIAYKEDGAFRVTEPRGFIADLDGLPFPIYNDFDLRRYNGLPEADGIAAVVITSRGCPYPCTFCSASEFWHRRWRSRSPDNVLEEMEWLYRDFDVRAFMIFDDNFAVRNDRAIGICQGILKRNLKISWVACAHVNQVNVELLGWMKKAGCYRIDYGVESGSPKILKNIKKGQTVEQIREAFKMTHEAGIRPRAYLMVGNPGEDEETIKATVDLMKEIKPYNAPSGQLLWVLPDTEIYELAKSKGIISDDFWLSDDSLLYYTGDHSVEELRSLRERLMLGLARNQGNLQGYLEYFGRKIYYNSPLARRLYHTYLAKWAWLFRWFRSGDEE